MTFNNKQSLFLLWSCLLNQQQKGATAINNAKLLMERLGLCNQEDRLHDVDSDTLRAAFFTKPQIHRFGETMCGYVDYSLRHLRERYDNEPGRLFENLTTYEDLTSRLSAFKGIGAHKIRVTCEILNLFGYSIPCSGDYNCQGLETGYPLYAEYLAELG